MAGLIHIAESSSEESDVITSQGIRSISVFLYDFKLRMGIVEPMVENLRTPIRRASWFDLSSKEF
jgi:hypothetical protein